jgi:hypothetical protein
MSLITNSPPTIHDPPLAHAGTAIALSHSVPSIGQTLKDQSDIFVFAADKSTLPSPNISEAEPLPEYDEDNDAESLSDRSMSSPTDISFKFFSDSSSVFNLPRVILRYRDSIFAVFRPIDDTISTPVSVLLAGKPIQSQSVGAFLQAVKAELDLDCDILLEFVYLKLLFSEHSPYSEVRDHLLFLPTHSSFLVDDVGTTGEICCRFTTNK